MKTKQNQDVKSFDIVALIGLVILCFAVLHAIMGPENRYDKARQLALKKAESLGYQVIQIQSQLYHDKLEALAQKESSASGHKNREIASVNDKTSENKANLKLEGEIGQDPWGLAYKYKISQQNGHQAQLYIWSYGGPNADSKNEIGVTIPFDL